VTRRDTADESSSSSSTEDLVGPDADGQDAESAEPQVKLSAQAILEQMGGISGLIYSSLPVLVFVPVSSFFGLKWAIGAALGVAALILVWRLVRHESVQPAVSGFFAVGVSALIAYLVGASKGYFLLGIWSSLIYAWGWINGHGRDWRGVRRARYAFDAATCIWALVFAARFLVQNRLYDQDQTGLLGVTRIAMGWPLTAVAALATYFAIRTAQRALHAAEEAAEAASEAHAD
jgi:Protein of unknown function (DUF3159)